MCIHSFIHSFITIIIISSSSSRSSSSSISSSSSSGSSSSSYSSMTAYIITVKPVLKATCIKQSPAFKATILDPIKGKEVEIYRYQASACLKQSVFGFTVGACLTQVWLYSQTCVKQAPMGKPKIGCLKQVLA